MAEEDVSRLHVPFKKCNNRTLRQLKLKRLCHDLPHNGSYQNNCSTSSPTVTSKVAYYPIPDARNTSGGVYPGRGVEE